MRVFCLGGDVNYPCLVVSAKGCMIMLDCSLNMKSLQHFLPQMLAPCHRFENMPAYKPQQQQQQQSGSASGGLFSSPPASAAAANFSQLDNLKEFNNRVYLSAPLEFIAPQFNLINVEDLDVVLISNYNSMLALPYLTRLKGFRAVIYCTEPVMQYGKMLMEDLTHCVKSSDARSHVHQVQQPNEQQSESIWQPEPLRKKYPLLETLSHLAINLTTSKQEAREDGSSSASSPPPSKQAKRASSTFVSSHSSSPPPTGNNNNNHNSGAETTAADDQYDDAFAAALKQNYALMAQLFQIGEPHLRPMHWRALYSREDVQACVARIKLVGYSERVSVFGSLVVEPRSAGYSLGSCNWTIELDCDAFTYLARSSLLSTHAKPYSPLLLRAHIADALLVSSLNQAGGAGHEPEQMIADFGRACIATLKGHGSVLVPVLPTGKVYDLIEYLYRQLGEHNMSNVPVYFVSSVAHQSLAYANIYAEWLCDARQTLVYAAESPFTHSELARSGLLRVHAGISAQLNDEFQAPCVLFASHPSLRFGEACHFVELWKSSPANSIIFTEPEFNYLDALAPYQPIYANFYYFPIDTSLSGTQLVKLLKETKHIGHLVVNSQLVSGVPAAVSTAAAATATSSSQTNNQNNQGADAAQLDLGRLRHQLAAPNLRISCYTTNDIVKLDVQRKYENVDIEPELAAMIMPSKSSLFGSGGDAHVNGAAAFATFSAQLVTRNNRHVLRAVPRNIPLTRRDRVYETSLRKYVYGKLTLDKLLVSLRACGLAAFKVSECERIDDEYDAAAAANGAAVATATATVDNLSVSSVDKDTLLVDNLLLNSKYAVEFDAYNRVELDLRQNTVNVVCDNEDVRNKVKDALLKCLKVL